MPKIVVLDASTLAISQAQWDSLSSLGSCVFYPKTDHNDSAQIAERCAQADIVLTNKVPMGADLFARLPALRCICVTSTGYNVIDTLAAKAAGIFVCNIPAYGTDSVAQHTLALILALTNHVAAYNESVQSGQWVRSVQYWYKLDPVHELAGKTAGIIGFGAIGRKVGEILNALGMRVLACARNERDAPSWANFAWASMDTIFKNADVVSLHCPQTAQTQGLVNSARLSLMKKSAILINTARGGLVDEGALAQALATGQIAGAGVDVLASEPMRADCPLWKTPNCVITPHVAWASEEAMLRLFEMTRGNIEAFIAGKPRNVVNP